MTYDEIADAMDKQTDALLAAMGTNISQEMLGHILTLRRDAAECRNQAVYDRRNERKDRLGEDYDKHMMEQRLLAADREERSVVAAEKQADALTRIAAALEAGAPILYGPRGTEIKGSVG